MSGGNRDQSSSLNSSKHNLGLVKYVESTLNFQRCSKAKNHFINLFHFGVKRKNIESNEQGKPTPKNLV